MKPNTRKLKGTTLAALICVCVVSCADGARVDSKAGSVDEKDETPELLPAVADLRPDIVVVVADDMRWDIMSGKGHPFARTPNLDQFVTDAASMENAFVPIALCSPSRATILTGREPHVASAPGISWRNNSFLQTQRTFAEDLQAAGYKTAYIGKWHLGDGSKPKRGFDHWESFDWLGDMFDPIVHINGEAHQFTGYADDILSARADEFLRANAASKKPIFLMVGLKAPHLQFEHPVRHNNAYVDVDIPKPDSYFEDFSTSGKQQAVKDWLGIENFACGLKCFDNDWNTYIKKHYRAILGLDESVGTLRAALSHRNKPDNTLFIYTSDNGYTLGEHGLTEKHMIYEEPVRVPFIVDFPGQDDTGYRFEGLVSTLDIAPTALDYAEATIPDYMTGRSLKPLVDPAIAENEKRDNWRKEIFLFYTEWQVGLRTDRYKYIKALNEDDHIELYDLQEDPRELQTVHADPAYSEVLAQMKDKLDATIRENGWSQRIRKPVTALLVSSPVPINSADELARRVSQGSTPDVNTEDQNGLSWRKVDSTDKFQLGNDLPANSSVLIALPMERTTDWDPYVRIHPIPKWSLKLAMYVQGDPVWDNYKRRPLDFANPPMLEEQTLVVIRVDSSGTINMAIDLETPTNAIILPLESDTPIDALR